MEGDELNEEIQKLNLVSETFSESENALEDEPLEQDDDPNICGICREKLINGRVLGCLHVFCESCLDKKLLTDTTSPPDQLIIQCPTCNQHTKLPNGGGLNSLPLDLLTGNVVDVTGQVSNLTCTSCSSKDLAISRCNTCHNLLCDNCNSAHQYMRCFDSHNVVTLDELIQNGDRIIIHKPIMCNLHANDMLAYYCVMCQTAVCGECVKIDHKPSGHICESILDAEQRVKKPLTELVNKNIQKKQLLNKTNLDLDNCLSELSNQCETAKDLINESYQSYKALLEKCRDDALKELHELRNHRQMEIMEASHKIDNDLQLLENATNYATRLLEKGNIIEIMCLNKYVAMQLIKLNQSTSAKPKCLNYSIEFDTDLNYFETMLKKSFGRFRTEQDQQQLHVAATTTTTTMCINQPVSLNLPPPTQINGYHLTNANSNDDFISLTTSCSPVSSLPTTSSMQSSFDGGEYITNGCGGSGSSGFLSTGGGGAMLSPDHHSPQIGQLPPTGVPPPSAFTYNSMVEYNIKQLASLQEQHHDHTPNGLLASQTGPAHGQTVVSTHSSGGFNMLDLFGDYNSANTALTNLQALAKLGQTHADMNGYGAQSGPGNMLNGNGMPPIPSNTNTTYPTQDLSQIPSLGGATAIAQTTTPINFISSPPPTRTSKSIPMQIRFKFGQLGPGPGQFNSPHGFCLGMDEDIVVADTNNHRIQVFEKRGQYRFQFGVPGKDEGQLWYPRKVAVIRTNGKYVVCDRGNERSRMQIFTKNGHFIKKIAIRYIDIVAGLAVTQNGLIVAVDSVSPTVFVISEQGDLIRWFDCGNYMREPSDIAVHRDEFYVCDFKGHNVVVFSDTGEYLRKIGVQHVTNFPNGIDISDYGDILIGDSHGNRFHVAIFSVNGQLNTEYECPYVKVSRCCGLKITSEGYIVTLAKNNHHVLILNKLYAS